MPVRIIDNKRVDLTEAEWETYESICNSYDQGKELFKDLFETDGNGIIIFLKPPSKRFTSLEVITYLQSLMLHQHIRLMYHEVETAVAEVRSFLKEGQEILAEVKSSREVE